MDVIAALVVQAALVVMAVKVVLVAFLDLIHVVVALDVQDTPNYLNSIVSCKFGNLYIYCNYHKLYNYHN